MFKFKKSMFVVRYRWWIITATILIVLLSVVQLFRIKINPDLESYLPDTMLSRQHSKQINEIFGDAEPLLIVIDNEDDVLHAETLERIRGISETFDADSRFDFVFSLFQAKNIRSEEGYMLVDPVIVDIPQTAEERENLRDEIRTNELAYGLVVSEDFKTALIILSSNKSAPDDELMSFVHETIADHPGPGKIYVTGQPFMREDVNNKISRDLAVLLPVGLLLMFITLWLSFRELKAVFLPFSVVVFSTIVCVGLIPVFGWELSIIGVLIPIMMIAIANNYGVYFIARYQDMNANAPHLSMQRIVQYSVEYLTKPVVFCGLTTIVGILGLVTHLILPARQMGVVTSIGIAFALLASLLFVPATMSLMKKGKPQKDLTGEASHFFARLLTSTGNIITKRPKRVLGFFVVFFTICTLGLFFFKVAPDNNKVLPEKHQFNEAIRIIDKDFGGSKMLNVMIEGDAKDPKLLNKLIECEEKLTALPQVGSVTSLATVVVEISKAMNDPDSEAYGKIPDSREAVAQYILLYSMDGDPEDLERFVDFNYTNLLMTIQFKADKIADIDEVLDNLQTVFGDDSPYQINPGGYALVEKELSEAVVTGQNYSLIFAFFAIIILLAIIFRSITAGLMGSIPLVFAVFCTFGLMGWLGIELNIVTALLSSISIGLGVDFTIHIFWRIKWELALEKDYPEAIKNTLITIGRGITINAFSVMMGFAVLFLSGFPLIRSFAFLIIISLFLCLICALVLIPALSLVFKPKFLEKSF
ncbi:MAG: MMPL family transporter [Bacteroidales bacterium]|jgi:hydrophobe/amphiphile efflux-3 (HAE3) family protein|nr:MMPL family transporter [Bacteroidales bacterium]